MTDEVPVEKFDEDLKLDYILPLMFNIENVTIRHDSSNQRVTFGN